MQIQDAGPLQPLHLDFWAVPRSTQKHRFLRRLIGPCANAMAFACHLVYNPLAKVLLGILAFLLISSSFEGGSDAQLTQASPL
jgi:hypothetical protein